MVKIIDGENFKNMMLAAAAAIEEKKQEINELNVFPVPDGDTGTNMSMTLNAAAAELMKFEKPTLGKAVDLTSSALLRGARGNSGVITSLLFRGFGKRLKELGGANAQEFAEALQEGVNTAYKAVMKPTEGTILTVSRLAAEGALKEAASNGEVDEVLSAAITAAREALENTVNQNPVLKKAGVVDAGGYGWVLILENMHASLTGVKPKSKFSFLAPKQPKVEMAAADFSQFDEGEINFAYCTEFIAAAAKFPVYFPALCVKGKGHARHNFKRKIAQRLCFRLGKRVVARTVLRAANACIERARAPAGVKIAV